MKHNLSIKYWNSIDLEYKFIGKNNTPTGRYALYSDGTISIEIKETYEERYYIFFKKLKTRKILVPEDDIEFIEIYQCKG